MFISGIYSLSEEINTTETGLSTSAVDIEIEEFNKNNQPFDEDGSLVMPGDEISLIPRINNLGIDCYIRTKIEYVINNDVFQVNDYIDGNYKSWIKKGEYYYYDSILSKNSYVELFDKVVIPDLSDAYNGKSVVVHIVVEAVQAKNFNGNWNEVEIKRSIDRTYDIDYDGESSVLYEDNTNHHISLDDRFFDRLGNMLPGDSVSESINLLNKSESKNEYYLSIDYNNLTSKELALLQNIKILVKNKNGKILIDSNLANKDNHILGIYKKGEEDIFTIEISLPKELDNDYSKLYTKIKWKFSYKVLSKVLDGYEENNPKTGDFNINISITVFILSSIGLLITLFMWKKETVNIENMI